MKKGPQTSPARALRQRLTPAERTLWAHLRRRRLAGAKFRRQQPIGRYIVDFVSFEQRLVIEIDGGHHNEPTVQARDQERTLWLEAAGYRVFRFWNNEVEDNLEGVVHKIAQALNED